MKFLKRTLLFVFLLLFLSIIGIYLYLLTTKPDYDGEKNLRGLTSEVETRFDDYGIPHIYAKNEHDAYYALGFLHAQERLFQMEMVRRIGAGKLAEILGKEMVQTDLFFRTLGINKHAEQSASLYFSDSSEAFQKSSKAYLAGINEFIKTGPTPPEFSILGIPKTEFTPVDLYLITGYLSFSFSEAFRTDLVLGSLDDSLGSAYINDLMPTTSNPSNSPTMRKRSLPQIANMFNEIEKKLPVPLLIGSNAWVLAPSKSKSGKVLFANDTHIGFSQPAVWFEAHINYPGFSMYGNHLAGFPFALIGHNNVSSWGLTLLENDDVDFYREQQNPNDSNQVFINGKYENIKEYEEIINVKNEKEVKVKIRTTTHGPLVNNVMGKAGKNFNEPLSMFWTYTKFPAKTMQATYLMNHGNKPADFEMAASIIHAPGLNILYGDTAGNIAWYTAAKLLKQPASVNSLQVIDGWDSQQAALGYFDFTQNPKKLNPTEGYIISANHQPDPIDGIALNGYYAPGNRVNRIENLLKTEEKWSIEELKKILMDVTSDVYKNNAEIILSTFEDKDVVNKTPLHKKAYDKLKNWNGDHQLNDIAPTIYYKLLSTILSYTMLDELGEDGYNSIINTHTIKKASSLLLKNNNSVWWDNIKTDSVTETRNIIFITAFEKTVNDLQTQLGNNIDDWQWGKVHTLEHGHLIGRQKPLDKLFNVGEKEVMGGNEVINNQAFPLNNEGKYTVSYGPAMRILIDFADYDHSQSILPTGESGHFMSKHYKDQADMYNRGAFRKQMTNKEEIFKTAKGKMTLKPKK